MEEEMLSCYRFKEIHARIEIANSIFLMSKILGSRDMLVN